MRLSRLSLMLATLLATHNSFAEIPATLEQQQSALRAGKLSATELLQYYEQQIAARNPATGAVQALDPQAKQVAARIDQQKKYKGALTGLPLLLKDNIDAQGMITTAGSIALAENLVQKDAPLVARLRAAGAVIVGKTNLSEWANLRSSKSTSGWSSAGAQVRNPYDLSRSPCGSSSGSGAAVAARMIPAAIGTETDGSIVCPASVNGLVGLKPTVGLVSRTGIVPISHTQDTAGPMTLSVKDAALLLNVMAGSDPADPATVEADKRRSKDYAKGLSRNGLQGRRLGLVRQLADGYDAETKALFQRSLAILKAAGATVVEVDLPGLEELDKDELTVLLYDFKADLNQLSGSDSGDGEAQADGRCHCFQSGAVRAGDALLCSGFDGTGPGYQRFARPGLSGGGCAYPAKGGDTGYRCHHEAAWSGCPDRTDDWHRLAY